MSNLYDDDVIAWAAQQVQLLRSGRWSELDINNIAEEIDDVGKSERRELQSRVCILIAHLLKWSHQPGRRGRSWSKTIREQRSAIDRDLKKHPGLSALLSDADWMATVYLHARTTAFVETGQPDLPEELPWAVEALLSQDFWPE
jgi:hypothetical protein